MAKIEKPATISEKGKELTDHEVKTLLEEEGKNRVIGMGKALDICRVKDGKKEDSFFFSLSLEVFDLRQTGVSQNKEPTILFRPSEKSMLHLA